LNYKMKAKAKKVPFLDNPFLSSRNPTYILIR
jgi:hypothetical protein